MTTRTRSTRPRRRAPTAILAGGLLVLAALPAPLAAQTITGTLMDLQTERPIDLGLVMMFTEAGDSVALTVTDERGRFSLSSPEPGSFILLASALGYEETPAGVFELGEDGAMNVEYRLPPQPLAVEELVVSLNRPVLDHHLVRNGFVRRLQRGLGAFITPHDIETSPARATEDLLTQIPGVRVGDARSVGGALPRSDLGQVVQLRSARSGWCTPTVYVDGMRSFYDSGDTALGSAMTLSTLAPLSTVEAIEVYRRPAEIPVEYGYGTAGGANLENLESEGGADASCGVLVVWTRSGLAAGQVPSGRGDRRAGEIPGAEELPPVQEAAEEPPSPGESIRLDLRSDVAARLGLTSPWEGRFLMVRDDDLVASDERAGRPVAVPIEGVQALQVLRERGRRHAVMRGALAGTGVAFGMWQFLKVLCGDRACEGVGSAWFPAVVTGVGVSLMVGSQGPGTHWVWAPVPAAAPREPETPDSVRRPPGGRR